MSKVTLEDAGQELATGSFERRRNRRADMVVCIDYATVDEMFPEFTRDINEGGVFIETEKPKALGTQVTMHFNLPGSEERIETVGRVVRISAGDEFSPPGMGIEFDELSDGDREKIDAIVRTLRLGAGSDC